MAKKYSHQECFNLTWPAKARKLLTSITNSTIIYLTFEWFYFHHEELQPIIGLDLVAGELLIIIAIHEHHWFPLGH